jgi:hypothetical protein
VRCRYGIDLVGCMICCYEKGSQWRRWGVEGDAWRWRRRLFAWEEESVEELTLLLQNVSLQVHLEDIWKWKEDSSLV